MLRRDTREGRSSLLVAHPGEGSRARGLVHDTAPWAVRLIPREVRRPTFAITLIGAFSRTSRISLIRPGHLSLPTTSIREPLSGKFLWAETRSHRHRARETRAHSELNIMASSLPPPGCC